MAEVARVGLNETEAREKGIAYEVARYDLDDLISFPLFVRAQLRAQMRRHSGGQGLARAEREDRKSVLRHTGLRRT
ncbi:MAG: hypothetical protein HC834_03515, partial [Rhodospirillales bacterium]|nr:hypothetical protein [Rhodospirillales bacterium]